MKLSRIATVAAAVSLAPAVFLATPASADDVNTGQSQARTVTEPEKDTAGATTQQTEQEAKATLTAHFPEKLVTGSENWAEFSFDIDNTQGEDVAEFSLRFTLKAVRDGKDHPKAGKAELEYQDTEGKWHPVLDPSAPYGTVSGTVKDGKLDKGAKRTVTMHIKLGADFPRPASAHVKVEASGVVQKGLPHITVEAQPPSPSPAPEPATHGGDKSNQSDKSGKATASPSPAGQDPSASPKPSPSTSASASASASASPSPAPATGGGNTASGSGDTAQLASTGAGSETPWLIAGSAAALVAGTGMVVAARRRSASRG